MEKLTSRKLWFSVGVYLINTLLLALEILPPEAFESIAWAVLIGYSGGNVGEHFSKR